MWVVNKRKYEIQKAFQCSKPRKPYNLFTLLNNLKFARIKTNIKNIKNGNHLLHLDDSFIPVKDSSKSAARLSASISSTFNRLGFIGDRILDLDADTPLSELPDNSPPLPSPSSNPVLLQCGVCSPVVLSSSSDPLETGVRSRPTYLFPTERGSQALRFLLTINPLTPGDCVLWNIN